eukprot:CAMPEP_0203856732 /NCGR_PEP_ID=MMETSP0359-20131031/10346_1 /ASSEMBLY_ACC=CAM_ASM_000338 /TAXON_ID=268821 /ORGANISM="Scrippsiella Hangoei, Strain SHTV-5" /LENGTH=165 /DNA_ID=CAMNT_0050773379 /DNA_START=587 /DNA_END=1084 /DNA_ORIENTATION=-
MTTTSVLSEASAPTSSALQGEALMDRSHVADWAVPFAGGSSESLPTSTTTTMWSSLAQPSWSWPFWADSVSDANRVTFAVALVGATEDAPAEPAAAAAAEIEGRGSDSNEAFDVHNEPCDSKRFAPSLEKVRLSMSCMSAASLPKRLMSRLRRFVVSFRNDEISL